MSTQITLICIIGLLLVFLILQEVRFKNPYIDEIHREGNLVNNKKVATGYYILYKRTYKNGKVKFIEKEYK